MKSANTMMILAKLHTKHCTSKPNCLNEYRVGLLFWGTFLKPDWLNGQILRVLSMLLSLCSRFAMYPESQQAWRHSNTRFPVTCHQIIVLS